MFEEYHQREQTAKLSTHTLEPLRCFNIICYDDDDDYDYKESTIPLNIINSQIHSSIVITTSPLVLPIEDPEASLIIGNEELNTILEKESDEFIKPSVEDLVPIPSESEDTSVSESVCILPSCNDFCPIDIPEEKSMTFSNPLFNSNDDFIPSNDELLSNEDVLEDNVLENIESKDSYDSNLDKPDLLVTYFSDANKDECFDSRGNDDEINVLDCEDSYYDSEGDIIYLKSLLNDDLVHRDPSIPAMSNDDWKKILYDAPILMTEEKVFDLGIHDQIFSPTYVSLPFTDIHYLFFTYVVRIFLPHIIYPVVIPFLISSGSDDTIFDPGIFASHFSHQSGTSCNDVDEIELLLHRDPSTPKMSIVSILQRLTNEPLLEENDNLFDLESKENEWKKILIALDFEDSRAHGFVHRLLELQSLAYGNPIS
nr:hypothetical protein [Tanacetum cinerariifolium]